MLDGVNKTKLEDAVNEEIKVLQRYEKKQEEIIKRLESKAEVSQYTAICGKMASFRDELSKTLVKEELL